jgi:hypothetical protein
MRLLGLGVCGIIATASVGARAEPPKSEVAAQPADHKAAHERKDEVKISEGDRPEWTRQAVVRMRQILSELINHLETARNERDVMLLNCINEKLTAVKGLLKISEQADVSMQEAVARRDGEAASHEFDKIRIALGKSEELSAAAQACVGELAVYAGDTQVEVETDGVSKDDPTDETGEDYVLERPPAASPFL